MQRPPLQPVQKIELNMSIKTRKFSASFRFCNARSAGLRSCRGTPKTYRYVVLLPRTAAKYEARHDEYSYSYEYQYDGYVVAHAHVISITRTNSATACVRVRRTDSCNTEDWTQAPKRTYDRMHVS
eukprot:scaffold88767_cov47-Prasinocladus_malaysianus.AAC.2